jgi:hypothetical protein
MRSGEAEKDFAPVESDAGQSAACGVRCVERNGEWVSRAYAKYYRSDGNN